MGATAISMDAERTETIKFVLQAPFICIVALENAGVLEERSLHLLNGVAQAFDVCLAAFCATAFVHASRGWPNFVLARLALDVFLFVRVQLAAEDWMGKR